MGGEQKSDDMSSALLLVGLPPGWNLDDEVGASGDALSSGQRQFVAIARATLSKAKVVVLDEPTVSCDGQTDGRLQELFRQGFTGRTVTCIAHRLNTILGYDRVLVMEAGQGLNWIPQRRSE